MSTVHAPEHGQKAQCLSHACFRSKMGRVGFEPTKAYANGFTARPLWPLGHRPIIRIPKTVKTVDAARPFIRRPNAEPVKSPAQFQRKKTRAKM